MSNYSTSKSREAIPYYFSVFCLVAISSATFAKSSVWKVTQGYNTVYLGGTCHLLRKADYPLPKEFDIAYAASDELVFEVDPALVQSPEFAIRLMAESVYRDGRTLKSVLSAEAYEALSQQAKKSNLPIEVIQNTKPGTAIMMLTLQEFSKAGVTQEGVDSHYHKKALRDNKPIASLETADFQLDLITSLGDGNESEFVIYGIQDLDKIAVFFDTLIQAWKAGNLPTIEQLFVDDMKQYPEIYNQFVVERNKNWLPQIETMLMDAPTEYILVGAGHMVGEDGVIELLEAKGYEVSPVESR